MFNRGNVLRDPKGKLMIVIDPDSNALLPIDSENCTVYPPMKDRYRDEWVYNEATDEDELVEVLEASSIKKYKYVAKNIEDYIITRLKELVLG